MPITTGGMSGRTLFATRFAARDFTLLLFALCTAALHAQTITFKIVNGQTGRPVANVCVSAADGWWQNSLGPVFIRTDKNGVAQLRLTHKDNEVGISYNLKLYCGPTGAINPVLKYEDTLKPYTTGYYPSCAHPQNMPDARWKALDPVSTKEVLQNGFVSMNMCGKVTALPHPGEVVLFVRPRTFSEKVHDWQNSDAFPF